MQIDAYHPLVIGKFNILNRLMMLNGGIVDQSVRYSVMVRNGLHPNNDIFCFSHIEGFGVKLISLDLEFLICAFPADPGPVR